MSGEIPQSTALAEATPDSLSECMSRDPEGFTRQDRDRIIEAYRAQRERAAAGEAAAPKAKAKGFGGKAGTAAEVAPMSAEDLGL